MIPTTFQNTLERSRRETPFDEKFQKQRKVIQVLVSIMIVLYCAIIGNALATNLWSSPICSTVPILMLYNIVEVSCFADCKQFSWPTSLVCRLLCMLHDVSYFAITVIWLLWGCDDYYFSRVIRVCFLFGVVLGTQVTVLNFYSQLPRQPCCYSADSVQPQVIQIFQIPAGQQPTTIQLQPGQQLFLPQASTSNAFNDPPSYSELSRSKLS